jgi:apolipoprotein N-acyltransferase
LSVRPSRRWGLLALMVALAAGVSQALALAWPGTGQPSGVLQMLGLAVFYGLLLHCPQARLGALLGWCFASAWLCASLWWLFISMHRYGGLAAPLAALAVLALAVALATYYALAAWLWTRWRLRQGPGADRMGARVLLFALLLLGAELLRGTLWTGLPWGGLAYAHVDDVWLRPYIAWVGVYGLAALAALAAAALAEAVLALRRRQPRALWAALLPLLWVSLGSLGLLALERALPSLRGQEVGRLSVRLLQGNIPQDQKFVAGGGVERALTWYGQQLWSGRADLLVLPETAIPLLPMQLPPAYWAELQQSVLSLDRAALIGLPLGNSAQGYTNSVLGIAPGQTDGQAYRYDKHHLVPFGEFIPPLFRWFTSWLNIPLGDFKRGPLGQAPFVWRGQRIAPNICYEDLFGEELARGFRSAEQAPTLLVNVSNIGWFGDTLAVDQHLQIARMRALEFKRTMLRATNTGATAVIDEQGRVTALAQPFTEAVLTAEVSGRSGNTPYASWVARLGLTPLWLLALLAVGWAWRRR